MHVTPTAEAGLARSLALAGRGDEARRKLSALQTEASRSGIYAPGVATVLLALNDVDGALGWLERSYDQRHPDLRFIGRRGSFDRLTEIRASSICRAELACGGDDGHRKWLTDASALRASVNDAAEHVSGRDQAARP